MLMNLKHTKDNVEDYGLTFAIDDLYNGTVELKENGSQITVTKYTFYLFINIFDINNFLIVNQKLDYFFLFDFLFS